MINNTGGSASGPITYGYFVEREPDAPVAVAVDPSELEGEAREEYITGRIEALKHELSGDRLAVTPAYSRQNYSASRCFLCAHQLPPKEERGWHAWLRNCGSICDPCATRALPTDLVRAVDLLCFRLPIPKSAQPAIGLSKASARFRSCSHCGEPIAQDGSWLVSITGATGQNDRAFCTQCVVDYLLAAEIIDTELGDAIAELNNVALPAPTPPEPPPAPEDPAKVAHREAVTRAVHGIRRAFNIDDPDQALAVVNVFLRLLTDLGYAPANETEVRSAK